MNVESLPLSPFSDTLRRTKQCAALTSTIRESLGGVALDSRETDLIDLANELADSIYRDLLNSSAGCAASSAAFAVSGKLHAVTRAIIEANSRAAGAVGESATDALVTQVGWLQNTADDLAQELVGVMEDLVAQRGAA